MFVTWIAFGTTVLQLALIVWQARSEAGAGAGDPLPSRQTASA